MDFFISIGAGEHPDRDHPQREHQAGHRSHSAIVAAEVGQAAEIAGAEDSEAGGDSSRIERDPRPGRTNLGGEHLRQAKRQPAEIETRGGAEQENKGREVRVSRIEIAIKMLANRERCDTVEEIG